MHLLLAFLSILFIYSDPSLAAEKKWSKKMHDLADTVSSLLPDLVSNNKSSSNDIKRLEKQTKRLMDLAHTVNMGPNSPNNVLPPDADPTITFISSLFERETKHAYQAIKAGQTEYAKSVLKMVTGYCIACHTRNDQGPDFPVFPLKARVDSLPEIEKGELFAATRQFDKALASFESVIANTEIAKKRQIEWGRAVRNAFMISIRVKRDPDKALSILQKIETLPSPPEFFKGYLVAWKESITHWKKEGTWVAAKQTEESLFKEATRLMEEGRKLQKFQFDHSADVQYLRASSLIHDLLSSHPHGRRTGEGFKMAGIAYELLEDRFISPLPEMYYEACIRQSPHTKNALECFQRYEERIYFGYSGSGGTSIPEDVSALLQELKSIAAEQG